MRRKEKNMKENGLEPRRKNTNLTKDRQNTFSTKKKNKDNKNKYTCY